MSTSSSAAKSSWDMSAPFGFSIPDFNNLTGAPSADLPSTQPTDAPMAPPPSTEATDTPAPSSSGLGTSGILMIICTVLVLLTVVTYVSTGSFLATLVVIAILIGFILLLNKLGILTVSIENGNLDIQYHELNSSNTSGTDATGATPGSSSAPAPSAPGQRTSAPKPVLKNQVFHIGGNEYTYDDAPAVCAAYDADLATYDQVTEAYNAGGEWCAYGWSQGGMALYPTQKNTWTQMQVDPNNRTKCGRPGVNGGYFDPATKFGVNCYGQKPPDNTNLKYPLPLPGSDSSAFAQLVNKFRSQLNTMPLNAFNRTAWSQ